MLVFIFISLILVTVTTARIIPVNPFVHEVIINNTHVYCLASTFQKSSLILVYWVMYIYVLHSLTSRFKYVLMFCLILVKDPPFTIWIMILGITLPILVLLGLFAQCRFIWKAYRKRQLCCWTLTKNANNRHAGHNEGLAITPDPPGKLHVFLLWCFGY